MAFVPTLIILTLAASLGCWLSYLQGRWLGHTSLVKGWLLQLPAQYHQRAHNLFNRHGLMALMIGRFLGFVRTLLPTIAGISGLNSTRFHLFNWLSAAVWVGTLVSLGYAFSQIPLVKRYESQVMTGLMLLPLLLLLVGLLGAMLVIWRKKRASA
ncbi:Inner membrane protein YghB [Serratia plymuthica]|nr:Inner membrane protein YghB [Serratia plymuthica]